MKSVTPFDFRSDFSQPEDGPERLSISIEELGALLDDARRSTADMLRDEQVKLQADAMKESAQALKASLAQIVELAELLESAAISESVKDDAIGRVKRLAAELIDGQGNLFHV